MKLRAVYDDPEFMFNQYLIIAVGTTILAFGFLYVWLEDRLLPPRRRAHSHRR